MRETPGFIDAGGLREAADVEGELFCPDGKERLDRYLADASGLSRSQAQRLIREGAVLINGAPARANHVVTAGDAVLLHRPAPVEIDAVPEEIPLDIVYEDDDICVINKPQGLVVHPAPGHASGTLVNGLLYHLGTLSTIGGALRPGIVHRIDRMTSGLLVVAKNDAAHQALTEQFRTHEAGRIYVALVDGNLREDCGTVEGNIGRHHTDRKRMAVTPDGRSAVTRWEVLARFTTHTLLRIRLETGRTHQIRVHMAYIHHPVTGDDVYGSARRQLGLDGQALHGYRLRLRHPSTNADMEFHAPLPAYFVSALQKLGWDGEAEYAKELLQR